MDELPEPIILEIASYLPIRTALKFIMCSKRLWSHYQQLDRVRLVSALQMLIGELKTNSDTINLDIIYRVISDACKMDDINLINFLIKTHQNVMYYTMAIAAKDKYVHIYNSYLPEETDDESEDNWRLQQLYQKLVYVCAEFNWIDMVELFLKKLSHEITWPRTWQETLSEAFCTAIKHGHKDMIMWFLRTQETQHFAIDGFLLAERMNKNEIMELLADKVVVRS